VDSEQAENKELDTLMELYHTVNHETLLRLDKSHYNSLVYYKNVTIVSHFT
jgi:hypothetical protein